MNTWRTTLLTLAGVAMLASLTPTAAHAYTGPGAGLTAIGSLLALVAALLLALVGFVWYPLKRLVTAGGTSKAKPEPSEQ
jgi:hypothetical protein